MQEPHQVRGRVRFGIFEVDLRAGELRKHGLRVRLQEQPFKVLAILLALGDKDQAMNWLEKGYQERFNPGVLLRPGFDPLRSDARFEDLVRRIGLPR